MKRFYKTVTIEKTKEGYELRLDRHRLLTPKKRDLALPSLKLAEAMAEEWQQQKENIQPRYMPVTQLIYTAKDIIADRRGEVEKELAAYCESDLLCYRAEGPQQLVIRQGQIWSPILEWVRSQYAAPFVILRGVIPQAQPPHAIGNIARALCNLDPLQLAALQTLASVTGSLLVALAVLERQIGGDAAFEVSYLEELYQLEQWGDDPEAAARRAELRQEIAAVCRFLDLLSHFE